MGIYEAFKAARDLVKELNISTLPINPLEIAHQLKIPIFSYTEASNMGFSTIINELREAKVDGFCCKNSSISSVIIYDETRGDRVPFTIAHEIGHIRLNHHENNEIIPRYLNTKANDPVEKDADAFAGELLRSPFLIYLLELTTIPSIKKHCGISKNAATVGLNKLKSLKNSITITYKNILIFYHNQFFNYLYTKHCNTCHYQFIISNAKYCPICGNNKPEFGKDETPMHYKTYDTSPGNRVNECIRCENEDIAQEDYFCSICGIELTNKCYGKIKKNINGEWIEDDDSCKQNLFPNARFCPTCGCVSTYGYYKVLVSWKEEYDELKQKENEIPF